MGDTVIKVKVTAEDGNATQTYMVTVTRAAAMTPTCTLNTGDLWCGVVTVGAVDEVRNNRCIRIHFRGRCRCPVRHRVQCRNEPLHD